MAEFLHSPAVMRLKTDTPLSKFSPLRRGGKNEHFAVRAEYAMHDAILQIILPASYDIHKGLFLIFLFRSNKNTQGKICTNVGFRSGSGRG